MGLITFCALFMGSFVAPKMRLSLVQIDQLISQINSGSFTSLLLFTLFFILEQLALEMPRINSTRGRCTNTLRITIVIQLKWPILSLFLCSMLIMNACVIYKMWVVT